MLPKGVPHGLAVPGVHKGLEPHVLQLLGSFCISSSSGLPLSWAAKAWGGRNADHPLHVLLPELAAGAINGITNTEFSSTPILPQKSSQQLWVRWGDAGGEDRPHGRHDLTGRHCIAYLHKVGMACSQS